MSDVGILASVYSVALDQACVGVVHKPQDGNGWSGQWRKIGVYALEDAVELGLEVGNNNLS